MFNFLSTIFVKITSLIASVIIAVGLVSMPANEIAVVQNSSQPPQNEEILTTQEIETQKPQESKSEILPKKEVEKPTIPTILTDRKCPIIYDSR